MSKLNEEKFVFMGDGGWQKLKPEYFKSKKFKDKISMWNKILKGMNLNSKT